MPFRPNLGDLRQRIVAVLQDAQAGGHSNEAVLPPELHAHSSNLTEPRDAKGLIKDLQEREQDLIKQNKKLETELAAAKAQTENIPADFAQLQID